MAATPFILSLLILLCGYGINLSHGQTEPSPDNSTTSQETTTPRTTTRLTDPATTSLVDALGSYYLITVPKVLVAGTTENILVQLYDPEEPIIVRVTLTLRGETIAEKTQTVTDGTKFSLEVPEVAECTTSEVATLTIHLGRRSTGLFPVEEERLVTITCNNRNTFVQSDKAIYRPGQTVYFRVLTLDQNLIPDLYPVEAIWIEAPNQVRVAQWKDQAREENGLIDLSFQMTPDPVLGRWEIHVLFQGVKTVQGFVVEEYVLPRFEVTISVTSAILFTEEFLPVTVCGVYSYGRPVKGSVKVLLQATPYPYSNRVNGNTTDELETNDDGCADFELDLAPLEIGLRRRFALYSQKLFVTAEFTELASGIMMAAESQQVTVRSRPREMTWQSPDRFKPGLPYLAKISLELPNGSPSPDTLIEISCTQSGSVIFSANATTDGKGCVSVEVPTPAESLDSISCRPTFPDFPAVYQYDFQRYTIDPFARTFFFNALYSASWSYMQFVPVQKELTAGTSADLVLLYTRGTDNTGTALPDFEFQFLSRGNVINADVEVGVPRLITDDQSSYYAINLKLHVTPSMSPKLRIVAFFVRDIEVVTAETLVDVKKSFEHEVVVEFRTEEVKPGDYTNLNIKSDPGSLCAVGVVDRSVILLGGDNRLTSGKVFNSLNKYLLSSAGGYADHPPLCIPQGSGDDDYPNYYDYPVFGDYFPSTIVAPMSDGESTTESAPVTTTAVPPSETTSARSRRRKRQAPSTVSLDPMYEDGSKAFFDSGLIYMSNLLVETSPCRRRFYFSYSGTIVAFLAQAQYSSTQLAFVSQVVTTPAASVVPENEEVEELEETPEDTQQTVRTYFPETWLWDLYPIGSSGTASVIVEAPDTITDWVGGGFCLHKESGIGISKQVALRAFQPFFVDLNLPYSVIRGEEFPINLSVFSYLSECLVVEVAIQESAHFALFDESPQRICVCDTPVNVVFYIQPLLLGQMPIQIDATSVFDEHGLCGNGTEMSDQIGAQDSVKRDLLVEAEGVEEQRCYSAFFCPQDFPEGLFLDNAALLLPENHVPDSASGKLTLIGDILGPTLSNLENLVKVPYGCGEQNLLGLVPNIYALLYLTSTNQDMPKLRDRARRNIRSGYQRELNFRLRDGSYSAFGQSDGEGSAWLTAFVVRSFALANRFVEIDENDLHVSVMWLKTLQDRESGCFRSSGRVIHKAMQGGVNDQYTLTAYILLAICEAGPGTEDETVSAAVQCLEDQIQNITDNYAIALVTYSLIKVRSQRVAEIFMQLKEAVISDGGLVHWESNRPDIPAYDFYYRYTQPAIQVEITSYAMLSFLAYHEPSDAVSESLPIVSWLLNQQNPSGGFSSTQDTVVGLQALSEYAVLVFSDKIDIQLTVVASPPCEVYELRVTDENALVQQEQALPVIPTFLQLAATGEGCALVKVSWKYNVYPEARNDAPFILNYTVTPIANEISKYHMTICGKYTGDDNHSNMALIENKPQSGFTPIEDSLRGLKTKNLKRVDMERGKVIVYFQELTSAGDCVSYDVEKRLRVRLAREGILTILDYYENHLVTNVLYYIEQPEAGGFRPHKDCPLCSKEVTDDFEERFCSSEFVYKGLVGTNNNFQLYGDEREGTTRTGDVPFYLDLEFPQGCNCSLIAEGKAVLVMDDGADLYRADEDRPNLGFLPIDSKSAIFSWTFESKRAARMARSMCPVT